MNHSCVKLLQDSTCVSSYNWVVSRTSNTLPSFRQSLTTFNTSSSKFGLEFGWWKDRPPLLRTTRWPQNYQRITLTITLRLSQNNSTNSDKVGVAKNMSIVTTQEVWRMSWLEFKIQRQATSKYQSLGTAASCTKTSTWPRAALCPLFWLRRFRRFPLLFQTINQHPTGSCVNDLILSFN